MVCLDCRTKLISSVHGLFRLKDQANIVLLYSQKGFHHSAWVFKWYLSMIRCCHVTLVLQNTHLLIMESVKSVLPGELVWNTDQPFVSL